MALTKKAKGILVVLGLGLLGVAGYHLAHSTHLVGGAQSITQGQLASTAESNVNKTTDKHLDLPKFNSPAGSGTKVNQLVFSWNAQMAEMYANGGVRSSVGSLMTQNGIDLTMTDQPDCGKMVEAFIANANDIKKDPNTVPLFVNVMGDGLPGFTVAMAKLQKLGPSFTPIAIYFQGRSAGEDGFWGPADWKRDPKLAKGHCVAGVPRDGDMNIVIKWCADNNIKLNVQTKYIDSDALNVIDCGDFIEAGTKYIAGFTEAREVIRNGKTTGIKVTVSTDAYTSWTPVDVTVAEKKGGLVRLASTKEYTSQMPCVTFVLKEWADHHPDVIRGFIKALGTAGDQVRSFPDALAFAAKVSSVVYTVENKPADYWLKYYKGLEEKDATGLRVQLGGSQAFNLADAANMCGLGADHVDRYKVAYEYFGNQLAKLYPKEMAGWLPYSKIMDKSYINYVLSNNDTLAQAPTEESQQVTQTGDITNEVASKLYNIQFDLAKATIKPASKAQLDEILNSAIISGGLRIGIYGHTDNTGNPDANQKLSEARAQAVADYLHKHGMKTSKMSIKGYGDTQPVNGTQASDPSNRCVEIVQGS